MKLKVRLPAAALVALAGGSAIVAADNPTPGKGMSAEEKASKEAATPGEAHKAMGQMVGRWKAMVKMWVAPDQPPAVSHGTMLSQWVLGGHGFRIAPPGSSWESPSPESATPATTTSRSSRRHLEGYRVDRDDDIDPIAENGGEVVEVHRHDERLDDRQGDEFGDESHGR